ncbi:MAG: bifunctional biotin--[acetyl-CoA-carboxylase] ligase/biotin operon repressor BirA [Methylococcales symbiont of Iophon sp. n. MRB-2018]|nr:MAG: bifunctional biotin--[acetyl-CoA-carboxylase] ligase/biotin operon repressor BirA [Methylococcales symbiont of Iophon sp. n. MRB-2018]KAF3979444.1 MAG: bifunctional biotin--[acetyl-CoA-carboxylase] ligase/biotin operon repressor BirA [Methylococcales symbiont of Iophon sp. n. MRB-2018]
MFFSSNQKQILNILADAQFHSGTEIAEQLGISRSAVFKQLKRLTDLGLEVNAISGKGYQLSSTLHLLSKAEIQKRLTADVKSLITELEIHDVLDSTNRYLIDKARQSNKNACVCFAESQSAGKGRRGREWVSPFGSNIYLSILWRFQNGTSSINGLSLVVGVAVIRALKDCGVENIGLKWPNDIYWKQKKLAGILIEVSGESSGPCNTVIGLGLNFYLPEDKAQSISQEWVDLNSILSNNASTLRNKFAAMLLNQLMPIIANFEKDTLADYIKEWQKYDCMQGKIVNIHQGKQIFSGEVQGIDDTGLLLLTDKYGKIKKFRSGEVSFRSP